jgi:ribosomal protein S18 acetylase RimI-like enzyme
LISCRPVERGDRAWVVRQLEGAFGSVTVARKGELIDASALPGFVATDGGRPVGLLTYDAAHGECEVVAIVSAEEGRGIGRALMDAARDHAAAAGYRRLWLITTNDNTRAFRFYQLWGMDLCTFYRHGARRSRQAKPSLPERGADGIPLDHELELELLLDDAARPAASLRGGAQPSTE